MKKIYAIILGICLMALAIPSVKTQAAEDNATPRLLVESYTVGDDYDFGGDTTITLVLKNTSDTFTMTDIILSYASADSSVIPSLGTTNQVYVDTLAPGTTTEVVLNVSVVGSTNGYARASITTTYNYGKKVTYKDDDDKNVTEYQTFSSYTNSNSYIVFPVVTSTSFTVDSVNVASNTTVGSKAIVGIRYSNPGNDDLSDVKLLITYEGNTETVDIGTVKTGASSYLEHYISFYNAGSQTVSILIQYENAAGKEENLVVGTYTVEVKAAAAPTPTPVASTDDNGNSSSASIFTSNPTLTIIIAVICVIVIAGICGLVSAKKRK